MSESVVNIFYICCLLAISVNIAICLIRSILTKGVANRILSVNMISTLIIITIAILSTFLSESYLVDICLIYALAGFIAVVVLTKIYTGIYKENKRKKKNNGTD